MSSTKVAAHKRVDFGKIKHLADARDLLEIQIQSFKDFFQLETTPDKRNNEGLFKVFKENFPITDTRNIFVLEFLEPRRHVGASGSGVLPGRPRPACGAGGAVVGPAGRQ